jgi:hypothetical protein
LQRGERLAERREGLAVRRGACSEERGLERGSQLAAG